MVAKTFNSTFRKQRQDCHTLEGSLVYTVSSRPVRAAQQDPFSNSTILCSFVSILPAPSLFFLTLTELEWLRVDLAAQVKPCTPGSPRGFLGGGSQMEWGWGWKG